MLNVNVFIKLGWINKKSMKTGLHQKHKQIVNWRIATVYIMWYSTRFKIQLKSHLLNMISLCVCVSEWEEAGAVCSGGSSSSCFCPRVCCAFTLWWIRSKSSRRSSWVELTRQATLTVAWIKTWSRTKSETHALVSLYLLITAMSQFGTSLEWMMNFERSLCNQERLFFWTDSSSVLQPHHGAFRGSDRKTREGHDTPGASAALF